MLAVVVIIGLVSALVLPQVGIIGSRSLDDQAAKLAADLEFARQRTVMTSIPHRVLLDLERGTWRLEWRPPAEDDSQERDGGGLGGAGAGFGAGEAREARAGRVAVDLTPPRRQRGEFEPLPTSYARRAELGTEVFFGAVETATGPVTRGEVSIAFERDGTAEPATIRLEELGGFAVELEVRPLADAVVVRDADA